MSWADNFGEFFNGKSGFNTGVGPVNQPDPTVQGPIPSALQPQQDFKLGTDAQPGFLNKVGLGGDKILGMTPNSFAAIAGGLGSALSKTERGGETAMSRVGSLAQTVGQGQLAAIAADKQHKANASYLQKLFDSGFLGKDGLSKLLGTFKHEDLNASAAPNGAPTEDELLKEQAIQDALKSSGGPTWHR